MDPIEHEIDGEPTVSDEPVVPPLAPVPSTLGPAVAQTPRPMPVPLPLPLLRPTIALPSNPLTNPLKDPRAAVVRDAHMRGRSPARRNPVVKTHPAWSDVHASSPYRVPCDSDINDPVVMMTGGGMSRTAPHRWVSI